MRILQIIVMLKGLRVSLLCYMWVILLLECPHIKKDTCSNGYTSKINLNCYRHDIHNRTVEVLVTLICNHVHPSSI